MKASLGIWIGWLAIILAVAGFFYAPFWLGGGALVLGLFCLAFPQKLLAWISIMLGVIVIAIQLFQ
ncbi:MAG: hypothetical protein ABS920_10380 [Sporosarcina sp.]